MPSTLLDLAGAKAHINVTTSTDDVEMSVHIDAAVEMVEALIGPVDARSVSQYIVFTGMRSAGPFLLDAFPVLSLDSLTVAGAATPVTTLHQHTGGVIHSDGILAGPAVLTYTAGRSAGATGAMKLATRTIFAHLWATQRGSGARGRGGADEDAALGGLAWAVPNRAADLLRPHLLPPAVA